MWLLGAGEREKWGSYCLMGTEFQFCRMETVLETDGGDGYTAT